MKAAHDTAASAASHAKAAHLPSDSKIAQMSSKPMAHVEAKGEQPPAKRGRACCGGPLHAREPSRHNTSCFPLSVQVCALQSGALW